jgi:hypothetical protein
VTLDTRWPEAWTRRGLIATPHALATEAGRAAFRREAAPWPGGRTLGETSRSLRLIGAVLDG